MKINEVESLIGITKKNIRFYEDQGLITPARDKNNGYRYYYWGRKNSKKNRWVLSVCKKIFEHWWCNYK